MHTSAGLEEILYFSLSLRQAAEAALVLVQFRDTWLIQQQKRNVISLFLYLPAFLDRGLPRGNVHETGLRSHARCHPYPIPQLLKFNVCHTTRVYDPYSFQIVTQVLLHPTRTNQCHKHRKIQGLAKWTAPFFL